MNLKLTRSVVCCALVLLHFRSANGEIFLDVRYNNNQVVYYAYLLWFPDEMIGGRFGDDLGTIEDD